MGPLLRVGLVTVKCSLVLVFTVQLCSNVEAQHQQKNNQHLNDFTVKNDAHDLLALPSDLSTAHVSVVQPPLNFVPQIGNVQIPNGPVNQYISSAAAHLAQSHLVQQEQARQFLQQSLYGNGGVDNRADESFLGGPVMSYAPFQSASIYSHSNHFLNHGPPTHTPSRSMISRSHRHHNHPAPYYNYHNLNHHHHRYLTRPQNYIPSLPQPQPTVLKPQETLPPSGAPSAQIQQAAASGTATGPSSSVTVVSPPESSPPSGPNNPLRGGRQLFNEEPSSSSTSFTSGGGGTYTVGGGGGGNYSEAVPGPPYFPEDSSPYFQHYNPGLHSAEQTSIPLPPPPHPPYTVSAEGAGPDIPYPADFPTHTETITESGLYKDQKFLNSAVGSGLALYKNFLKSPLKVVDNIVTHLRKFSIPKEHYLNVISFVGVYLFMSILFFGYEDFVLPKCEDGDAHLQKEWHYHVGRRFVPQVRTVDEKLQKKFLELFRGLHLEEYEDTDSGSSSEETGLAVNDLCPRGTFFYSMAPMHVEARQQVQRLLVAQPTPFHVYKVAKDLLYKHKIHPKIWYLGLLQAALERPDMTGFKLAYVIDAIPDWFIPAPLIQDEMDKYRSRANLILNRPKRSTGNSTLTIVVPDSPTTDTTSAMPNITTTVKTTRRPLFTKRPSHAPVTRPAPTDSYSGSAESGSLEGFNLAGLPIKGDYGSYDEDTINQSIQKYQQINQKGNKYVKSKNSKKKTTSKPEHENKLENDVSSSTENLSGLTGTGPTGQNSPSGPAPSHNDLATVSFEIFGEEKKPVPPLPPPLNPDLHDLRDEQEEDDDSDSDEVIDEEKKTTQRKKHKNHRNKGKKKKGKGKGKGKDEDDDCIIVDGKIGRDNGIENKLWYFREDLMVNQHHWYWHLVHPLNATAHPDRRAELFFFTHRQFLARYESERLSNGLNRMVTMEFGPGGIMFDPYHSHLADVASGKYWTPRHAKRMLRDIHHIHNPDIIKNIELQDAARVYKLLQKAVTFGIMISTNGLLPIAHTKGIEPLANTVEATELSVNPGVYDAFGLHNMGHLLIGLVEDPDWTYKKTPGVMADVATSMRDPIFYNYHAVIDNILERHKESLTPYKAVGGEYPLLWKGVDILDVELVSKGNGPLNQLRTFWTKKKFELSPSVDRSTAKEEDHAKICAVHLAHEPFTFKITIERKPCSQSKSGKGTIRIFIAPRYDEKGKRIRLRDQRRLMIQLDAFQAKLRVGRNIITRRSHDSSLTQPWTKSLADFENTKGNPTGAADFCGCGWPQHLYIPKGSPKGMPYDLFVMVTNFDEDYVPNDPKDLEVPETCNSPYLFCGHPRRRYPDAKPMGYPFDRPPYRTPIPCLQGYSFAATICKSFNLVFFKPIDTLEEFVTKAPNMKSIVFDIRHIDKLVSRYYHN